jgi:hypothetical protein
MTAYERFTIHAAITPGIKVLINGATKGVGTYAHVETGKIAVSCCFDSAILETYYKILLYFHPFALAKRRKYKLSI